MRTFALLAIAGVAASVKVFGPEAGEGKQNDAANEGKGGRDMPSDEEWQEFREVCTWIGENIDHAAIANEDYDAAWESIREEAEEHGVDKEGAGEIVMGCHLANEAGAFEQEHPPKEPTEEEWEEFAGACKWLHDNIDQDALMNEDYDAAWESIREDAEAHGVTKEDAGELVMACIMADEAGLFDDEEDDAPAEGEFAQEGDDEADDEESGDEKPAGEGKQGGKGGEGKQGGKGEGKGDDSASDDDDSASDDDDSDSDDDDFDSDSGDEWEKDSQDGEGKQGGKGGEGKQGGKDDDDEEEEADEAKADEAEFAQKKGQRGGKDDAASDDEDSASDDEDSASDDEDDWEKDGQDGDKDGERKPEGEGEGKSGEGKPAGEGEGKAPEEAAAKEDAAGTEEAAKAPESEASA